jgi:hypothetical protein
MEGLSEVSGGNHSTTITSSANASTSRHDGLTRGTLDLKPGCQPGQDNCDKNTPYMSRYAGYRSFEEPVSDIVPCVGPRGLHLNESDEDAVWAYEAVAKGETAHRRSTTHIL